MGYAMEALEAQKLLPEKTEVTSMK